VTLKPHLFALRGLLLAAAVALLGAGPAAAAERDPLAPRVPADKLAELKAQVNPEPDTPEVIAEGQKIFRGVGSCNVCHGEDGNGQGIGASGLDPSPRNFTNQRWQAARSDGELMWVLRHGSPGSAMITVVPGLISEADGWKVIRYLRTFGR
jgi:mono/diheme cytochrome c family protein